MITSYYTTKLGLQPETLAYIQRVEADGGEVISIQAVENAVKFLKKNEYTNDILSYLSPRLGIKKDSAGSISKMYSLFSGVDFIQARGSYQPIFNIDTNGMPFANFTNKFLRNESIIPVITTDETTISSSAIILRGNKIRFLCRGADFNGPINGFDPNKNAQHFMFNGNNRIGKRGDATLNGFSVNGNSFVNERFRYTYTYDGSNNDDGFDSFIDDALMTVVEDGTVNSLPENMEYGEIWYGRQHRQLSNHDMYDMIFIRKKLTQSQISELNTL